MGKALLIAASGDFVCGGVPTASGCGGTSSSYTPWVFGRGLARDHRGIGFRSRYQLGSANDGRGRLVSREGSPSEFADMAIIKHFDSYKNREKCTK